MSDSMRLMAKGAIFIFITMSISKVLNLLLRVIIARKLGPSEYGLISLGIAAFSIAGTLALFGLSQGIERNISFYKKKEQRNGIILGGIKISLPTAIITSVILFLFADIIAKEIFHNIKATSIIKIFSLGIPFWCISEIILSAFKGFKKIEYYSYVQNIAEPAIKLLITTILVFLGFKIVAVSAGYLITFILIATISTIILNKKLLRVFKLKTTNLTKELFHYSWPLLFAGIAAMLVLWTDTLMLGYLLNETEVGIYNVAAPIAGIISFISAGILSLYTSVVTSQFAENKIKNIKHTYITITRWIFLISFPLLSIVLIESRNIISIIFGKEYLSASLVLVIIAATFFINGILGPGRLILTSIGKTKYKMFNNVVSLVANILLNIYLIPKFGIVGAAIATSLSLIVRGTLMLFQVIYILKIQPIDRVLIKLIIISGSTYLITALIPYNVSALLSIIITSLLTFIIYIVLIILTKTLQQEEKEILKLILNRIT